VGINANKHQIAMAPSVASVLIQAMQIYCKKLAESILDGGLLTKFAVSFLHSVLHSTAKTDCQLPMMD
jgi:hypothetical protein